jgi:hypothetical protein
MGSLGVWLAIAVSNVIRWSDCRTVDKIWKLVRAMIKINELLYVNAEHP